MAQKRDWVDYTNLASNIVQNLQLGDMQHKLGAVASVMQEEQDTAKRENQLRDAVFQADTMLRNLQKGSKDNPRASLAWARHNLLQFERNEVTSASFRSYEDKERLRSVVEGHEQLIQECAAGLSAQQRDQTESCGHYLAERGELDLLIELKERQAQLNNALEEQRTIEKTIAADPVGSEFLLLFGPGLLLLFFSWCNYLTKGDFSKSFGIPDKFCSWLGGALTAASRNISQRG